MTAAPIPLRRPTDPLADLRAQIAHMRRQQLDALEDALTSAAEAAQTIGEADPVHDPRTRQFADRTAAVLRRAVLDLQGVKP